MRETNIMGLNNYGEKRKGYHFRVKRNDGTTHAWEISER